jgi:hypothetical protein
MDGQVRNAEGDPWGPTSLDTAFILSHQGSHPVVVNGIPDLFTGYHSDFDNSAGTTGHVADSFGFDTRQYITGFVGWGLYAFDNVPSPSDSFTIRIFGDVGGSPGPTPIYEWPAVAGIRTPTALTVVGFDVYRHEFQVAPMYVPPGSYFLSVVNDTTGVVSDWWWASTSGTADGYYRVSDGDPWVVLGGDLAFEILTTPIFADGFESGDTSQW